MDAVPVKMQLEKCKDVEEMAMVLRSESQPAITETILA